MIKNNNYPIVLLHGSEGNSSSMDDMKYYIQSKYNRKVYNINLYNTNTLYTPMNKQLNTLCKTIYNIHQLKNGFDFIGLGQGGLLARGYVEKCNKYMVHNLITILSPHGGIYMKSPYRVNSGNLYSPSIQNNFTLSNYWRDPYNYNLYLTNSTYLADINNEYHYNEKHSNEYHSNMTYKMNMMTLNNFIMIYSTSNYSMIYPPESAKFSMYRTNKLMELKLIDLFDTELYNNDWLGLKELYKSNRLHIYNTSSYTYSQHTKPIFFNMLGKILNENN
jgi:palmitoyl-protein thioesterase